MFSSWILFPFPLAFPLTLALPSTISSSDSSSLSSKTNVLNSYSSESTRVAGSLPFEETNDLPYFVVTRTIVDSGTIGGTSYGVVTRALVSFIAIGASSSDSD